MPTADAPAAPPRQRVLDAAAELFYLHGIKAVGVQRVVDEAHVTLATFYRHFPSKEALVVACLQRADEAIRREYAARREETPDAAARLARLTALYGEEVRRPGFRGCAFINAGVEFPAPGSPVRSAIAEHRRWLLGTVASLFAQAGAPDPEERGRTWLVLRDGAMVAGYLGESEPAASGFERAVRGLLGDAAQATTGSPVPEA